VQFSKPLRNRKKTIIRQYTLGWMAGLIFLVFIRSVGTVEVSRFNPSLDVAIFFAGLLGGFFGMISGYFQFLLEEKIYRQTSIKKLLIIKGVYLLAFVVAMIFVAYLMSVHILKFEIGLWEFATDAGSGVVYLYIIVFDLFMLVLRQVNLMLGEGNLTKLLMGEFYEPHEEERIFMFLDLQSSTQLAEKLGHITYSNLIQDCFYDLGVVLAYEAEIYQYVGDEAILTWPTPAGIRNNNCLKAFYAFQHQIELRKEHYEKAYGIVPFFKAGVNLGKVTTTEVGKYKREIAYHGDTLNTAARIQAKCNELEKPLLISQHLKDRILGRKFVFHFMGEMPLKGKEEAVAIYAVEPAS
jgi:adenylate cyclase